jgi:hypothetical protein
VQVIQIDTGPDNLKELSERASASGHPGLVRRQIAANDGRSSATDHTETSSPAQVSRRVDLRLPAEGWRKEIWVSARSILLRRPAIMAAVAVRYRIHQITAQPNQSGILSSHIEWNWRNGESLLNSR